MSPSQSSFAFIERPYTEIMRLAWPIAVSFLSYATMNLVGTLFVGRLGPSALAAVGLGGVAAFTLLCFGLGAVRGVKVIISQAAGAGRAGQIQHWVGGVIAVAAALSVAVLVSGPALARLLEVLADRETGKQAAEYLLIRNLGAPFVLIAAALREVRYGLSDSRTPMRAALVANLANIALDAWFILGLGWGVSGIALATVFSCALELGMLLAVQRPAGFGLREFGAAELRRLWALGWPLGLQFLLEVGAFAILVAILARVGRVDLAAHHIALQLIHFAFLPALAIGEAASVLSGRRWERAWIARSGVSGGARCTWPGRTLAFAHSCSPLARSRWPRPSPTTPRCGRSPRSCSTSPPSFSSATAPTWSRAACCAVPATCASRRRWRCSPRG